MSWEHDPHDAVAFEDDSGVTGRTLAARFDQPFFGEVRRHVSSDVAVSSWSAAASGGAKDMKAINHSSRSRSHD
jgi:hypothetical protein